MTARIDRSIDETVDAIVSLGPLDAAAMAAARAHLDQLTKPPGSLGRLEDLAVRLAGISGQPRPPMAHRAIIVAAADHGVARRGVSAYPPEVTAQMVANFVGGGAAINALAAGADASLTVVDVGVAGAIPDVPASPRGGRLIAARIRPGTGDMAEGPAMTRAEAIAAMEVGLAVVGELRSTGLDLVGIGDMGIGNTTAASAIVAVLTGAPPGDVTGRGTGIDEAARLRKVGVIQRALARNTPDPADPIGVLAAVGGLEIAALVGVILGAVAARVPVVLDGFITGAAALVAADISPPVAERVIAAHRSVEPGHAIVLARLGLRPLLDLDLRLGEGTGAALVMQLIDSTVRVRDEMATFSSAAISGPLAGADVAEGVVESRRRA
jgi:nicotinate-nucleotide--dimethylbenzimidazole phosphoribosyltransferase